MNGNKTPPRARIYTQLFDVLMDREASWSEKATALGIMRRLVPVPEQLNRRGPRPRRGPNVLNRPLAELIREAIHDRVYGR